MDSVASRLKYIRSKILNLSRGEIESRYGLSANTLTAWENGRIKVSSKGIEKCIDIYAQENLIISRKWLETGKGFEPRITANLDLYFKHSSNKTKPKIKDDTLLLFKEIEYFRSLSKDSITAQVHSTDMLPLYDRGDHVGGRLKYGNDIKDCVNKDCIIKTNDGHIFIRRLVRSGKDNGFTLVSLNPNPEYSSEPVLYNVSIESVAPIIWHRRPDNCL